MAEPAPSPLPSQPLPDDDLPPLQTPVVVQDAQGNLLDADATELNGLLRSGQFRLAPDEFQEGGTGVPVTIGGETRYLPVDQAEQAIRSFEGDSTSAAAAEEAEARRYFTSPLNKARAASAAWLSGMTFGGSDQALTAIDPGWADELAGLQRANPDIDTAGRVGGMVLPLLTGGLAGAGVRGVAAGAEAAGGAAARALGGGAVARAAGAAVRGGLEVGAMEVGAEISAAALQRRELDAAKVASAFGHGAIVGGVFMGGGSLLLSGARAGAGWAADAAGDAIRTRVGAAADALGTRAEGLAAEARAAGQDMVARGGNLIEQGADQVRRIVDERFVPYLKNDLREPALEFARDKALSATGGTQRQLSKIIEGSPAVREAADGLLTREIPEALGKKPGAILTRVEMAEGLETARRKIGSEMGEALKTIDANARGIGPDVGRVVREAEEKILTRLESNAFAEAETNAIRRQISALAEYQGQRVGFEGMHELSSRLGETIRRRATSPELPELKQLKGLIDDEILAGAERVSEEIGGDLAAAFRTAKQRYAAASMLDKAIETGVAAEKKNATIGLREMLGGGTGTQFGAAVGGLFGGAPGALVGGLVGGAAGSAAARLSKVYGDQIASTAIRRFYEGASPAAIAAEIDAAIGASIGRYLAPAKALAGKAAEAVRTVAPRAQEIAEAASARAGETARGVVNKARGTVEDAVETAGRAAAATTRAGRTAATQVERELAHAWFGDPVSAPPRGASKPAPAGASPAKAAPVQAMGARGLGRRLEESKAAARARYEQVAAQYPDLAPEALGALKASDRAHDYLLSILPKSANQLHSLTPNVEEAHLSKSEKAAFLTALRVVASPLSVLESLDAGTLSRIEVETLQATSPELYAQIQTTAQARLDAMPEPLPYRKALDLSLLLGVVGHPALDPRTMAAIQAAYAAPAAAPSGPPSSPLVAPKRQISASRDWSLRKEET